MPPKVPRAARTLFLSLIAPLSLEVASPNWVDAFPLEDSIGLFLAISFLNCATAALASDKFCWSSFTVGLIVSIVEMSLAIWFSF